MSKITSCDNSREEPLILYGLIEKRKKPDKMTKKFLDKVQPIIQEFKLRYEGKDFTELSQFEAFKNEIKGYFLG
ncbi:MAG: hypothetical protein GF383_03675 [Candidatus Lokiarchaeota archaeon]|nr:hypothetical protein [Candidatus Lokiarchaeota archaeon]MBD3338794.1 hypothetical protein [Candidatus Lokiarchaeota archaeon]